MARESRAARRRRWWRLPMPLMLLGLAASSLNGCPKPPEFPGLSEDCAERHESDALLGKLAIAAMVSYGRIDPFLYERDADTGRLRVRQGIEPAPMATNSQPSNVDAKPPTPGMDPAPSGAPANAEPTSPGGSGSLESVSPDVDTELAKRGFEFSATLAAVNQDDVAFRTLLAGQAAAVAACSTGICPEQRYRFGFDVEVPPEEDAVIVHWQVKDELPPTAFQWQEGFLRQYSYIPQSCLRLVPSLRIPDPARSLERGAALELSSSGKGYADPAERYASGQYSSEGCATSPGPACCTKDSGKRGVPTKIGDVWCCRRNC